MKELIVLFRCMQLYAHNSHNLVSGPEFFSDHKFLGELYPIYETAYDNLVERMLGFSDLSPDELLNIQTLAFNLLRQIKHSSNGKDIFKTLITCEEEVQVLCGKVRASVGTLNFVQQLADDSEARSYKLKQRVK